MVGWDDGHEFGRTKKPSVLQFMGLQGIGHNLATEQQQHVESKKYQKILVNVTKKKQTQI